MSLGHKTGKAGLYLLLRKVWAGVLNIIIIAYLARILNKSDFGLMAISGALISFVEVLGSSSIIEYLIYRSDSDDDIFNSAFWLNFFIVIIIMTTIFLIAPIWAAYYTNEKITNITYILGISFVGYILSTIPMAILRKSLNFKHIIIIQLVTGTASQIMQLILVIYGFGVYSLAIPSAIFPFITGVYLFVIVKPKIKFDLGVRYWKEMLFYLRYIIGSKILTQIENFGDNVIIGKTLGLTTLGVYDISYKLSNILNEHFVSILTDVTMPVFAIANNDLQKIRSQYVYMMRLIALVFVPLFVLVLIFSRTIIVVLYGLKWVDAILPLQILTVLAATKFLISPSISIYYILKKPKIPFYFMVFYIPLFVLSLWFFSYNGLIISCSIVLFFGIIKSAFHFYNLSKMINLQVRSILLQLKHVLIPNLVVAIIYLSLVRFVDNDHFHYVMMLLYIPLVYVFSFVVYKNDFFKDYVIFCKLFPHMKLLFSK